jgi:hypothetical protein
MPSQDVYNRLVGKGVVSVGTSPVPLVTEAEANQPGLRAVMIQADGALSIGAGEGVAGAGFTLTAANGIGLTTGQILSLAKTHGQLYAVAATPTTCRVVFGLD